MIKNLSPSRASQFKTCPKQFKFANIDKIKEPTTEVQAKAESKAVPWQFFSTLYYVRKFCNRLVPLHKLRVVTRFIHNLHFIDCSPHSNQGSGSHFWPS